MSFHSISELALGSDSGNWPNSGLAAWHITAYRQGPNPSSMSAARNSFFPSILIVMIANWN
jgi:hypothetical protein